MNYIQLIRTALAAIKSVEALMPDSTGKEKADAALAMIEEIIGDISAHVPALLALFTQVVSLLRTLGVFKAKAAAQ